MFDHVKFGVSDFAASKAFFLEALAPLGIAVVAEGPPTYGVELCANGNASLCLFQTDEKPAPLHLAFTAERREQVDEFHDAALRAGATDNGAPGLRPHYHAGYYAAFVIGPDGHNIEVVCHERGPAGARVTVETLQAFADAWNRHDVDALMSFMTEDCVFEASAGPEICGTRYVGVESVRAGFADVWKTFPDAHWGDARHVVAGDRGVSEWTFTGTRGDGTRVEVHGCDLFTFRDGKIAVKNSYRKNRSAAPPAR